MATQRCLYEILGVQSAASSEEIRSAYRKLALKCHPDKIQQTGASAEACQEATFQFQEIGRAYEVLSDPSERSWYDSHRAQILSSSSSSSSFSSDFDFNPWPFFSPSAFAGYGDTGNGFFAVYGDLFSQLHQQEKGFARTHGLRPPFDPPDMGNLSTPYAQVQKFYNYWLGFSTVKDFAWCDEFRASAGPNRKLRRLMEEENKKIRSKARKEFIEVIRRLAAFVKKRDKRVLEQQIEIQRLEKEKQEMRIARRKRDEEEKLMKAKLYEEVEWTKVEEEHGTDDGSDFDDTIGSHAWGTARVKSKKDQQAEFYCIVCSKKFKSDEQWRNHEKSKKHLEKVAILKESFEEEDKEFEMLSQVIVQDDGTATQREHVPEGLLGSLDVNAKNVSENEVSGVEMATSQSTAANEGDGNVSSEGIAGEGLANARESESDDRSSESEDDGDDDLNSLLSMVNMHTSRHRQSSSEDSDAHSVEEDKKEKAEEEDMLAAMLKSSQIQTLSKCDAAQEDGHGSNSSFILDEDKDDKPNEAMGGSSKKKRSKGRLRNEKQQVASLGTHSKLAEELSRKNMDSVTHEFKTSDVDERDRSGLEQEQDSDSLRSEKNTINVKKLGRRANSSSKGNLVNGYSIVDIDQARKPARGRKSKASAKSATNTCETCGEDFESRNQLFKHISVTQHAILKGK